MYVQCQPAQGLVGILGWVKVPCQDLKDSCTLKDPGRDLALGLERSLQDLPRSLRKQMKILEDPQRSYCRFSMIFKDLVRFFHQSLCIVLKSLALVQIKTFRFSINSSHPGESNWLKLIQNKVTQEYCFSLLICQHSFVGFCEIIVCNTLLAIIDITILALESHPGGE